MYKVTTVAGCSHYINSSHDKSVNSMRVDHVHVKSKLPCVTVMFNIWVYQHVYTCQDPATNTSGPRTCIWSYSLVHMFRALLLTHQGPEHAYSQLTVLKIIIYIYRLLESFLHHWSIEHCCVAESSNCYNCSITVNVLCIRKVVTWVHTVCTLDKLLHILCLFL